MMASAASSLDTHAAVVISPSAEAAMNPFSQIDLDSHPSEDAAACSDSFTDNDLLVPSAPCCPVTLTVCGDPTVSSDSSSLSEASSEQHVNQIQVQSPDHDRSAPTLCPDTDPIAHPASCHVFIIQSPSPARPRCSVETYPDMECSICFSEFNNVFRCPKMLHCRHTFCLECLARINVKSTEPGAINCPLCRSLTQLPALGLPRLPTNSDVLSSLPAAMQRVYSIHFNRNKGKLQVKRSATDYNILVFFFWFFWQHNFAYASVRGETDETVWY